MIRLTLLLASMSPLGGTLLAQANGNGGDVNYVNYLLNGGPFAVVVLLLVMDKLTTPGERDRLRIELTASHEREERLNVNIRETVVPLMTRSVEATARNTEITERVFAVLSDEKRFPEGRG